MNKNAANLANTQAGSGSLLILALETSGRRGSVALAAGEKLLAETDFTAPMKHSRQLFTSLNRMLRRFGKTAEQVEGVYISVGPGSFTGLRIAVTMAKIMHLANRTKIVAVSTLDVIAENAFELVGKSALCAADRRLAAIEKIAAILDAKRGRFFVAVYEKRNGCWTKTLSDCLMSRQQFIERYADTGNPVWLLGEGLVYYKNDFAVDGTDFLPENCWRPKAGVVHKLGYRLAMQGKFTDALSLKPAYLHKPDVKIKK